MQPRRFIQLLAIIPIHISRGSPSQTELRLFRQCSKVRLCPVKHFRHNRHLHYTEQQATQALENCFSDHHEYLLKSMLPHMDFLEQHINDLEEQVQQIISKYQNQAYELLQTIPGIKGKAAATIIAEMGTDMSKFGSAAQLAAWTGLRPGQHQST